MGDDQPSCSRTDGHDHMHSHHHILLLLSTCLESSHKTRSGWGVGVSPEARVPLHRSLAVKNKHALSKHLGLPVVLGRQHWVSGSDLKILHFPDGVISAAMISTGPSGCDSARKSHKDLTILLDGGKAGLQSHPHCWGRGCRGGRGMG